MQREIELTADLWRATIEAYDDSGVRDDTPARNASRAELVGKTIVVHVNDASGGTLVEIVFNEDGECEEVIGCIQLDAAQAATWRAKFGS